MFTQQTTVCVADPNKDWLGPFSCGALSDNQFSSLCKTNGTAKRMFFFGQSESVKGEPTTVCK